MMDGNTIAVFVICAVALAIHLLDKPIKEWTKEEEQ